jgi:peptidoglycan/LPS O-acetylase OafA/YrhL
LNKETSTYLDLVRFVAALTVMIGHVCGRSWTGGFGWQFLRFGPTAVDVFFVLSGFVIAHVVSIKEKDIRTYVVSRLARLYSVCIPTLLITALLCEAGMHLKPAADWGNHSLISYVISALFLNQIWFSSIQPGNDGPYWSLGYEAMYYAIFAAAVFSPRRYRGGFVLAGLLIAGPRIVIMLPVWLMGVWAYHITAAEKLGPRAALTVWALSAVGLAAFAALLFLRRDELMTSPFARDRTQWAQYLIDYGTGILVAGNFIGFYFSAKYWSALTARFAKPITWLAGATFTLYLLHWPVAKFLIAISPWKLGSWQHIVLVDAGTMAVVFAVAQLTERKKRGWRRVIDRMIYVIFERRHYPAERLER